VSKNQMNPWSQLMHWLYSRQRVDSESKIFTLLKQITTDHFEPNFWKWTFSGLYWVRASFSSAG
jgi:hypothetical protein